MTRDGRQTLLYHTLYSALAPGFTSENTVVLQALAQITRALRSAGVLRIIFVLDRGFDRLQVLRRLRRLRVDFVIRACHLNRQTRLRPTGEGNRCTVQRTVLLSVMSLNWPGQSSRASG